MLAQDTCHSDKQRRHLKDISALSYLSQGESPSKLGLRVVYPNPCKEIFFFYFFLFKGKKQQGGIPHPRQTFG